MRDLKKQERTAIEAVARRFSATWDPLDSYIMVAGKRVAVDITTLKRRGTGQGNAAKPRLRFDKVATRLIEPLQASLCETVPDGMTVLLTITAPVPCFANLIQDSLRQAKAEMRNGASCPMVSMAPVLAITSLVARTWR